MSHPLRVAVLQLRAHDLAAHETAWLDLFARIDDAARDEPRIIVVPEGAYPAWHLGSSDAYRAVDVHRDGDVVLALGERARQYDCYIACGLPLTDGTLLRNASLLIAPDGRIASGATEARPSASWFAAGNGPVPAGPDGIPTGIVAGRDLEDPAVLAPLLEAGARLVIATGPAASSGRTLRDVEAPWRRYVAAARAAELGAWVVTPGLVGVEAGVHHFAGDAGVVSPSGRWDVRAPSDQPGTVVHTIDPDIAPGPLVIERMDLREPDAPSETAAASTVTAVAAVAIDRTPSVVDLFEGLRALVRGAAATGAALVVLPDLAGEDPRALTDLETLPLLERLSRETSTVLVVGLAERANGTTHKTVFVIDRGRTTASQRQAHLTTSEQVARFTAGDDAPRVVLTSAGAVGLLGGADGLVSNLAMGLRKRGASAIAWCSGGDLPVEALARVRARESALPFIAAASTDAAEGAYVVDSRGRALASTVEGKAMCARADLEA